MKQKIIASMLLLPTLINLCYGQKPLKYLPKALKASASYKTPLHTQFPRRININGINIPVENQVFRAAAAVQNSPQQFDSMVRWIDNLRAAHFIAANDNTKQAVDALREALINYDRLPAQERPYLHGIMLKLHEISPHLKWLPNGRFQRLIYTQPVAPGSLPQIQHFILQIKQNGSPNLFFRPFKKRYMFGNSFRVTTFPDNPKLFRGIIFFQGFEPQMAREELIQFFAKITPKGYQIRMGPQELGLLKESRKDFRGGNLHVHFEKTDLNARIPTQISMEFLISAKPFAGIIDVRSRNIILPNNDQTIARNYLTLFEPFLNEQGREALQAIINENELPLSLWQPE